MGDETKDPITVLHIFSGDLWAGAEAMIFNLLDQLKADPSLNIIALSLNDGILTHKLRSANVETHLIPESTHSFSKICLRGLRILRGKRIDIIHSHRYKENLLALLLAKTMRVKRLVTTLHGLSEPPLYKQNGEKPIHLKTKIDYFLLKRYFTRVVAVSREMKTTLVQQHGFSQEAVEVIYNGIPLPAGVSRSSSSAHDHFRIGTVGRMVPVKDFDLFLEIATEVVRENDRVRFSILGDGPLKEHLVEKAKELKISDYVDFSPPSPDPFPYYRSLDLYLNTSLHEGLPLSILEAMACGKPVVAPSVGGLPEIISHAEGFLIHGREPKDFVNSCLKIIQDKNLRTSMGESASKRVASRFNSFKMAECYRQSYRQLCKKS